MKTEPSKGFPSQIIVGGFVIVFGLLFLLDNLNIFDFSPRAFWPVVFIVFGIAKLLDTRSPSGTFIGWALIGVGTVLLLNRLGFIYFSLRTLWPILMIALGAVVVYKAVTGRRDMSKAVSLKEGDDSVVDITAILGGFERRVTTQHFRGGEVTAIMGGCELDMRGSSIDGEAVINVFAGMGGISIKVPPDWTVILHGTPILGGFEEKTATPPNDSKRLIIKGYAIMGGVEVRN